jgi:hypothetical protein
MNLEEIDIWCKNDPFVPFRLTVIDGRIFDMTDSSQIWPGKWNVLVIVPDPENPERYKAHATLSLPHVTSIEPIQRTATP